MISSQKPHVCLNWHCAAHLDVGDLFWLSWVCNRVVAALYLLPLLRKVEGLVRK